MISFRKILLIFCVSVLTVSCTGIFSHPHQAELQAAVERSKRVLSEARIDRDVSRLSEAFTQDSIEVIKEAWEQDTEITFLAEEIEIDWVEVIEYNPPEAIVEVKYFYRPYEYNRETGVKTYGNNPNRYWRIFKYRMRQEDGIWKKDETLEFVDWGS